jgi:tetratricopeptide (TPR) repeat protein
MQFGHVWAVLILALGTAACGTDPEVAKRQFLKSGDEYAAAGKLREAAIEYRNAIQQDPRFGEARLKLAEALLQVGDAQGAYGQFIRAADLLTRDVDAQVKAGTMNLAAQQFEDALGRADKALAISPQHIGAKALKANALASLKRYDEAIVELESVIAADPKRSLSYSNLGAIHMAAGNLSEAERSYAQGVEVDPTSAQPLVELATFEWRRGRTRRTEELLKKALALEPASLAANRALAALYVATSRAAEAETPLKTLAESTAASEWKIVLADYYRSNGRIADAKKLLDQAEGEEGAFAAARTRKAVIFYGEGRKPDAQAALDAALAKEPRNVEALLVKSEWLAADGKLVEALAAAESAASGTPGNAAAQFAVGRIRRSLGNTEGAIAAFTEVLRIAPRSVAVQLELSRAHMSAGQPRLTLQFAQDVLNVQPRNPDALLMQARALMGLGDLEAAARPTSTLVKEHASLPVVHVQLGELHRLKGDEAAARAAYGRALTIDPTNEQAIAGIVLLDMQAGRMHDARSRAEAALSKQPSSVALLLLVGRVQVRMQDHAAAERSFRRVIELNPSSLEAYARLGEMYRGQKRIDQAIAEFERLAERAPKPAAAHTMVGMLLESDGRIDEAKKRYDRALGFDPEAPVAANNLAWLIAEHGGNLDVALDLARTARTKLPDSVEVADTLGWVYYKKGLFDQAVPILKEVVARQPNVAAFHYHLGLSSARTGDDKLARTSLETALSLDPKAAQAADAKAELSRMGG